MDRDVRILNHTRAYSNRIVRGKPNPSEGANGDIALGYTPSGIKLFAKIGNQWHSFSADQQVVNGKSNVVNYKPSIDGAFTDATCDYHDDPTIAHDDDDGAIKVGALVFGTGIPAGAYVFSVTSDTSFELSASTTGGSVTNGTLSFMTPSLRLGKKDAGKTFVVDISENTAVFQLPPVASSVGFSYKFIMAEESDNENSKDFIVITNATSEDMMGPLHVAAHQYAPSGSEDTAKLGVARSIVQFNSDTGVITAGDFIEFICNGKAWYVFGATYTDNIEAYNDFTVL